MNDRLWIYFLFPGIPFLILFLQMWQFKRRRAESRLPLFELRRPAGFSLQKTTDEQWERVTTGIAGVMLTAIAPALIFVGGASVTSAIALGVIFCPICLHQLWKDAKPLMNYRLGVIGEQATGGVLDNVQKDDVRVFHDLVISENGRTWNIDHVVLTRFGLLCIETKARRKKQKVPGDHWVITFDGGQLHFPDGSFDSGAIKQTTLNTEWLANRASLITGGEAIPVFPILVFPGWMIKRTGKGGVCVVNHKEIRQTIPTGGQEISERSFRILLDWLERECVVRLGSVPAPSESKRNAEPQHQNRTPEKKPTAEAVLFR